MTYKFITQAYFVKKYEYLKKTIVFTVRQGLRTRDVAAPCVRAILFTVS